MRCIQLDFIDFNNAAPIVFGYQLRAGYMFSDVLNCVGNSSFLIKFKLSFDRLSITQKATILKKSTTTSLELLEIVEEYLKTQKSFHSMKHPANNIFLTFKNYERGVLDCMNEWRDQIVSASETAGLSDLLSICEKGVFDIYDLKTTDNLDTSYQLKAVDVLTNEMPENATKQSVFLLPFSFYEFHLAHTDIETSIDFINNNHQYLVKAFSLPNINTLSTKELISIKKQFATQLQTFKTAVYEWSKSCYLNNHSEVFINEVIPTFSSTEQIINDNDILKHCKSVHHNKVVQSIYFGAIEPINIWHFYLHYNLITVEEFGNLNTAYTAGTPYKIPVMLFVLGNNLEEAEVRKIEKNVEQQIVIEEIQSVKKHINIDD